MVRSEGRSPPLGSQRSALSAQRQALSTEIVDDTLVVTIDKPGDAVNTLGTGLVGEFEGVFLQVDEDTLIKGLVLISGKFWIALVIGESAPATVRAATFNSRFAMAMFLLGLAKRHGTAWENAIFVPT